MCNNQKLNRSGSRDNKSQEPQVSKRLCFSHGQLRCESSHAFACHLPECTEAVTIRIRRVILNLLQWVGGPITTQKGNIRKCAFHKLHASVHLRIISWNNWPKLSQMTLNKVLAIPTSLASLVATSQQFECPHKRKSCMACSTELLVSVCPINLKSRDALDSRNFQFTVKNQFFEQKKDPLSIRPADDRHELSSAGWPNNVALVTFHDSESFSAHSFES